MGLVMTSPQLNLNYLYFMATLEFSRIGRYAETDFEGR